MYTIKKDTAIDIPFFLHDTSGVAVTGATITTKRISKGSAGAFAAMTVTITELENGFYKAALTTSHTDTLGLLTLTFNDGTNPQVNLQWRVEANLVDDVSNQVGNLATGSAAISTIASAQLLTTGTEVNNYTNTDTLDGIHHEISDAAGALEMYYDFNVGGSGVAAEISMVGRLVGANDTIGVYAYNWSGASWDQIGTMQGANSTDDGLSIFSLLTRHTGTGANLGVVRIRGYAASGLTSATLYIDQAYVSYAVVAQSVGYALGAIWVNTNTSNTNTESYVDGVADNPVSTWAAALTLSSQLAIKRFVLAAGSSITLTGNSDSYIIEGYGADIALNGQSVSGSAFIGANITGNDDGSNTIATIYRQCHINSSTLGLHELIQCHRTGNITFAEAGDYIHDFCSSFVAGGTTPDITFPAVGTVYFSNRHYSGGERINAMKAGDIMSIEADGQFKIAASCTGGLVNISGCIGPITDGAGGAVTLTEDSRIAADTINAQVDTGIADALNDIADAILKRDFSAISGESSRSMLNALRFLRNKWSITGTTLTITEEDDTTPAWTSTIVTDAGANPITASDPANGI